jgi:DNA-directed RNA polymerase subunit beta'
MDESTLTLEEKIQKLDALNLSFDYLKLNVASPEQIKKWAERKLPNGGIVGEVSRPDTLNYRSLLPEDSGLFCQKIFGPIKDWKCSCGKYNGVLPDKICESCNVELIESRVRRYRMGYINLTCPVGHFWYVKGNPNYIILLLKSLTFGNITKGDIEEILYFHNESRSISPENSLYRYSLIKEPNPFLGPELNEFLAPHKKKHRQGAEIIINALNYIDLDTEVHYLRAKTRLDGKKAASQNIRILRIIENFFATKSKLSSIILTLLPVLPPNLRPLVEIGDSKLVSADSNELYRMILIRNLRSYDAIFKEKMPDIISYQGKKLLQEAVDCLIDNGRLPQNKMLCLNDRPLKSLTEALEGKPGRFRQTLLGKRVDYSARSVIVVGPNLRLNQCGLPYDIAVKIFEVHLLNFLLKTKIEPPSNNIKFANLIIKRRKLFIWNLLQKLMNKNAILLNRAPTLHKFGIQAFNPVLILGQAIQLHPLVCTGFNADFDGDQMAVHLPLYEASQLESQSLMRPSNNILSPANGEVILKPTQDMVIGSYYLSLMVKGKNKNLKKYYSSKDEALKAFYSKNLNLHDTIFVKYSLENKLKIVNKKISLFQELESLNTQNIKCLKIFQSRKNLNKIYLLTNLGIIVAYLLNKDDYILKEIYVETTVGRILFTENIEKVFKALNL